MTEKKHKNHSHSHSHKHGHAHHNKPKVDFDDQKIFVGSNSYRWKGDRDNYLYKPNSSWYRVSKTRCLRGGEEVAFVGEKERKAQTDSFYKSHGEEIYWDDVLRRVKDSSLVDKLEALVDRAEKRKEKREEEKEEREREKLEKLQKTIVEEARTRMDKERAQVWLREEAERKRVRALQKHVLAAEDAEDEDSPNESDSAASDSSDTKKKKRANDTAVKVVKRDKRGVKLFSLGGQYFFTILVNKATKYPGHANVRLMVAGKWKTYTLDAANMKAFREEVARGGN